MKIPMELWIAVIPQTPEPPPPKLEELPRKELKENYLPHNTMKEQWLVSVKCYDRFLNQTRSFEDPREAKTWADQMKLYEKDVKDVSIIRMHVGTDLDGLNWNTRPIDKDYYENL